MGGIHYRCSDDSPFVRRCNFRSLRDYEDSIHNPVGIHPCFARDWGMERIESAHPNIAWQFCPAKPRLDRAWRNRRVPNQCDLLEVRMGRLPPNRTRDHCCASLLHAADNQNDSLSAPTVIWNTAQLAPMSKRLMSVLKRPITESEEKY